MRIAKPLLLVSTPLGVGFGIYEAFRLAGGLAFLMIALVSVIGVVEIVRYSQIASAATYNFTPYVAVGLVFVVITVPLIHLVDWLAKRGFGSAVTASGAVR